jgi:hypothetical protein
VSARSLELPAASRCIGRRGWVLNTTSSQVVEASPGVKRIRGKLNVPRERFWETSKGHYRTVVVP